MDDACLERLRAGDADGAWDLFLDRYRRLIFATIRHYTVEADEVMDLFAHVCERLREDRMARLRRYALAPVQRAMFPTWLVAVLRNLVVDWFRVRDGRRARRAPADLSPLGAQIYECVFVDGRSHREAYELIRARAEAPLPHGAFLRALRDVHRVTFGPDRHAAGAARHALRPVAGLASSLADDAARPDERLLDEETSRRVEDEMSALAPDVRLAVQLFVVEEMPAADIARAVGWANAKAVYNRVYRGLATIRARLTRRGIQRADV